MTHPQARAARRRVLRVVANPELSPTTGWPAGFGWAELTHPYWVFQATGYEVQLASPRGGEVAPDAYSDPEHGSGHSADDLLSLGFERSARHAALLKRTRRLAESGSTGFAHAEERAADAAVGRHIQPFRIEEEARQLAHTNFVVHGPLHECAVCDGALVTGQQQHSGAAAARLVVGALGR